MRTLPALLAATLTTGALLAVPAEASAPSIELQPESLARGADIAIPHIKDSDFVDGARRIELPGSDARILGPSDGAWLVVTWKTNRVGEWRRPRVVRVEPDSSVRTIRVGAETLSAELSEDGSRLLTVTETGRHKAPVTVRSAADGSEIASRVFDGFPQVVTGDDRSVIIQTTRRTLRWGVGANRVRTLVRGLSGSASIEHDLFATYTKDPYLGGCTQLVRLSDRNDVVWRSCRERVAALSPDGTQMLTVDILADGVGPGEILLREVDGTRLASWSTNWFSGWEWESPTAVLLDVNGARKSATVRCVLAQCENATDPVTAQVP